MARGLSDRCFSPPEDTGAHAEAAVSTTAVFSVRDGRLMVYSCLNGGIFNAVDAESNRLCFSGRVGNIRQVWAHAAAPDGVIYIAGLDEHAQGELWAYRPDDSSLDLLASLPQGVQAWSCACDEAGNAYIGSYNDEAAAHIYKWDASDHCLRDLGAPDEGSAYVRSLACYEGMLFAGLGTKAKVMRVCPNTGKAEDFSFDLPRLVGKKAEDIVFAYDMAVAGGKLFVRLDAGHSDALAVWDIAREKWCESVLKEEPLQQGVFGFTQLGQDDRYTYVIYRHQLHRIDLQSLAVKNLRISFPFQLRGAHLKGDRLYTLSREAELVCFDLTKRQMNRRESVMRSSRLQLHHLVKANNGKLYASTYPGGPVMLEYDPRDGAARMFQQGQAESMAAGEENSLYLGIYPSAVIKRMDTHTGESETLLDLGSLCGQDRPYMMRYHDGLLLIGTVPPNGRLGGALAVYNTETGGYAVFPNLIEGQSICGLAGREGLIYGSTTIFGGLEATPSAREPVLFIFDIAQGKVLLQKPLCLPGGERLSSPIISGLCFDKAGRLWAAADGCLLLVDTGTLDVNDYKNIYPDVKGRGKWRPVHILPDQEGLLYTDLGGRITVVDTNDPQYPHLCLTREGNADVMEIADDEQGRPCIYLIENPSTSISRIRIKPLRGKGEEDA